jgi:uncharacterized protein YcnI
MPKTRRAAALAGAALTVLLAAGPASAHVTLGPDTAPRGGTDVELTFRVPDEEDSATTQVEVDLPTDHPVTGVLPEPVPGWTITVQNYTLPKPVTTDDGTVTQVVQKITWSGGQIPVGQFQGFHVMVGKLPDDVDSLTFKALQTYANGDVVRWIDVRQAGQPEPDHPAPVLTLTAAGGQAAVPSPGASPSPAPQAPSVTAASAAPGATSSASGSDSTARALGIAGVVLGVLGLAVGAFGIAAARRKNGSAS